MDEDVDIDISEHKLWARAAYKAGTSTTAGADIRVQIASGVTATASVRTTALAHALVGGATHVRVTCTWVGRVPRTPVSYIQQCSHPDAL